GFHKQHQFGGIVGGPIRRNKDLVFFSFEGWQEVVPFPATSTVPPLDMRDGKNFAKYGYRIYDPLTRRPCAAPQNCQGQAFISDPFPNNEIPESRISPIGKRILSYYPAPNAPNSQAINNNFVASGNLGRYYYNQPMGRWDHQFSEKDKLYAVVTFQKGYEFRSTTGFPKPAATGNTDNERINHNYIAAWTHVISPTTVLDLRASYGRFVQVTPGYNNEAQELLASDFGINMPFAPTIETGYVPAITMSGYGRLFAGDNSLSGRKDNQWNLAPSVNTTRGKHNFRLGYEFNYVARAETGSGAAAGLFDFNTTWTRQFNGRQLDAFDGSSVASLLLGYPESGRVNYNDTSYRTRPYHGFYIQDDWKVSPLLTLNLGLRYDVQVPWLERFNRANRGFDPFVKNPLSDQILASWRVKKAEWDAANPNARYRYPDPPAEITGGFLFPGKDGQPRRLYDTDWTNVAPRVGLAWRLGASSKTVLRTGAGVYYQSPTQLDTTTGFQQQTNFIRSLDGVTPAAGASLTGPYSLANPFPQGIIAPPGSSLGLLTNVGNGGISFDPGRFKIPRTYQYSFGFQHELPWRILTEASYTGNYQIYVNTSYNMNEPGHNLANQNQAIADVSFYERQLPNPFLGLIPNNGSLGTGQNISASNLLRPFPLFNGGVTNNLIQDGKYRSDQLQVKIEQRHMNESSGVLTWVFSYTWAKAFEQNHRLNNWNLSEPLIKELDNTDKAHTLAFSGVWDLPFGRGRRFFNFENAPARYALSAWRSSWIYTYSSGNPTAWWNWINTCGTWKAAVQTENSWVNNDRSCYTQYPLNTIRTVPDRFGDIRNPGVGPFLNMALEKDLPISERYKFMIRVEAFNVTNSVQRPGPNTDPNNVDFGRLPKEQLNFPRFFQLAGKFYF
ncbi:MAG TPA: hypothetical protein VEQ63_03140, partial [Bryobacteraceae bacterium]|nr:hypothetical protein [Bryobacteraceae bacterium]